MIDLVGLQALSAVRTHGSVVAAAEALGFTPSAVSQQLKKLERQAGAPVLERYGRGVLLTEIGKRLADRGAEVLASMEALQSDLAGATDAVAGRVHLAAFSTAVRGLVAPLLQRIALDGTPLEVTVVEQDPLEALDLVATGRVDVALVHHWGDTVLPVPDHVERVPIGIDLADILVPSGHRLAGRGAVSPADLRSRTSRTRPSAASATSGSPGCSPTSAVRRQSPTGQRNSAPTSPSSSTASPCRSSPGWVASSSPPASRC